LNDRTPAVTGSGGQDCAREGENMDARLCMINVMADVIGANEDYGHDRLNDDRVWQRFMDDVFRRMETVEDQAVREILAGIDREQFQQWIDDPAYWQEVDAEIQRRIQVLQTVLPSDACGHC